MGHSNKAVFSSERTSKLERNIPQAGAYSVSRHYIFFFGFVPSQSSTEEESERPLTNDTTKTTAEEVFH